MYHRICMVIQYHDLTRVLFFFFFFVSVSVFLHTTHRQAFWIVFTVRVTSLLVKPLWWLYLNRTEHWIWEYETETQQGQAQSFRMMSCNGRSSSVILIVPVESRPSYISFCLSWHFQMAEIAVNCSVRMNHVLVMHTHVQTHGHT